MVKFNVTFPLLFLLIFLMSLLIPSHLFPQVKTKSLVSLVSEAEFILTGRVAEKTSYWNTKKTRIYSDVVLLVDEFLKGNSADSKVTIKQLGGEVDGIGEIYSHAESFKEAEEVLVFLHRTEEKELRVTGGLNGKFTLTADQASGKKMIGLSKSLDVFKSEIKSIMNRQKSD